MYNVNPNEDDATVCYRKRSHIAIIPVSSTTKIEEFLFSKTTQAEFVWKNEGIQSKCLLVYSTKMREMREFCKPLSFQHSVICVKNESTISITISVGVGVGCTLFIFVIVFVLRKAYMKRKLKVC